MNEDKVSPLRPRPFHRSSVGAGNPQRVGGNRNVSYGLRRVGHRQKLASQPGGPLVKIMTTPPHTTHPVRNHPRPKATVNDVGKTGFPNEHTRKMVVTLARGEGNMTALVTNEYPIPPARSNHLPIRPSARFTCPESAGFRGLSARLA